MSMSNFSSSAILPRKAGDIWTHEAKNASSYLADGKKASSLAKVASILIVIPILFSMFCFQKTQAQEVTDQEIADLESQLNRTENEIIRIDRTLDLWDKRVETLKSEIEKLRKEPSNPFSRIKSIFTRRTRKLEKLHSELLDLSNSIGNLQNRRKLLVSAFVSLANELIDKSDSRMEDLMEVIRKTSLEGDLKARNAAEKLVSDLWQLAETTRESRNRYAPPPVGSEPAITFPLLRSDDPEDIRLGIAILKDAASAAREEVTKLEAQIEERQRKQNLLKLRLEIRRSDAERGIVRDEDGNPPIPWGSSDAAIQREIEEIGKEIDELSVVMEKKKADAERFEKQIEEQQATVTNSEPEERKTEDDL